MITKIEEMKEERQISADDYGFFLLSPTVLAFFLKDKGIKSKKLLGHFSKKREDLNQAIQDGVLLPINQIPAYSYSIFISPEISLDSLKDTWDVVLQQGEFNLKIDSGNSLWFISLAQFHNWMPEKFSNKEEYTGYYVESGPDGKEVFEYTGQRYMVDAGEYLVTVLGLKRKDPESDDEHNYGYYFDLKPVNLSSHNMISPDISPSFSML